MNRLDDTLLARMPVTKRWPVPLVGGGATLLVFSAAAAFVWPYEMARSFLFAYVFWLNVSLGAFGWLMLGHVTGGEWGRSTRRCCEAAAGLLPCLAVLGVPLLFGAHYLYGWADAAVWQHDPILAHRRPWISLPWVAARAMIIFAVWSAIVVALVRLSRKQDRTTDDATLLALGKRQRVISQAGIIVLFAGAFLLAVDWIMALEPHWISSIFGLVILTGQATSAIAGVVVVLFLIERSSKRPLVTTDQVHDLGKLLLTSLVLWAYMLFFQYLVQWMGHTQEDIHWYTRRLHGGWSWVAVALCVLHLGVPMLLLLSRPLKRSLASLAFVAAWIFAMRVIDILWTIAPAGPQKAVGSISPGDFFLFAGVGAVWVGGFIALLARSPLMPAGYLTSGSDVTGMVAAFDGVEGGVRV